MKCETCKFWDRHDAEYYLGLGRCRAAVEFWNATRWNDETGDREFTKEAANVKAFTQDGSYYRSILPTKADFGCVQWEEKSNAKVRGASRDSGEASP